MADGRMRVKVEGLHELLSAIKQLPKDLVGDPLHGPIATALRKGAEPVEAAAKQKVPVDEGFLKSSIKTFWVSDPAPHTQEVVVAVSYRVRQYVNNAGNRKSGRVGKAYAEYPAYYGVFVEFGTQKMEAQPFMRPAFDQHWREFVSDFDTAVRKSIGEALHKSLAQNRAVAARIPK